MITELAENLLIIAKMSNCMVLVITAVASPNETVVSGPDLRKLSDVPNSKCIGYLHVVGTSDLLTHHLIP